jgi:hypothetical protein
LPIGTEESEAPKNVVACLNREITRYHRGASLDLDDLDDLGSDSRRPSQVSTIRGDQMGEFSVVLGPDAEGPA